MAYVNIHILLDVQLGAYYEPRLLHDYGGTIFNHSAAKLLQRNITDTNGSLIPPWDEYDKLRTGTVVLMKVTFTVPVGNTRRKVRLCFPSPA